MSDEKTNNFELSEHVYRLLRDEPFFAAFSRRIHKRSSRAIPTAGVRINEGTQQFELLYNPDFMGALSDKHLAGVLKHEFYHIILEHVTSRKPADGLKRIDNIAMDLAINSHLVGQLPSESDPGPEINGEPMRGCFPGEGIFEHLPNNMTYEWYLEALKDMAEQQQQENGEGEGEGGEGQGGGQGQGSNDPFGGADSFDDHDGFGEAKDQAGQDAMDIAKERLKQNLKDAAEEANKKAHGWGSVPQDMRKKIMAALKSNVDWRSVLRYFVKTSERSDRRSTPRKINRRFPKIHPGKRVRRHAKIAISIDQSGSVDDQMLALFFAELNKLSELATFTIIPFDTRVDESLVYVWKKGQKRTWERVMCGGTDFDPPTRYVNEREFDGHIILTDMMAPKPVSSRCQRMWMTTEEYADRPYFTTNERVIAIKR